MRKDSTARTLIVAACMCVVCSVIVCTASVFLKPIQDVQREADKKRNVLMAAGVDQWQGKQLGQLSPDEVIKAFDDEIESRWLHVETGEFVDEKDVPPECLDEVKAAKSPDEKLSTKLAEDSARIGRRAHYRQVYLKKTDGRIERLILPIHGKGLWSTLYGFIALDGDMTGTITIKSLAFYQHGETPGLGGEVDNPRWKVLWVDKKAFDESARGTDKEWVPVIEVIKGAVAQDDPRRDYKVNGLSGATLTANGVRDLVKFWLGQEGYGPLLRELKRGGDHG
ncbi:MAG TPA: Na(+)-translocating NADH-quinone reductase subunit C [Thermoguttaceae bacterium]|nr:Na(+)-translocating NADH-quinone reductase subunit C [Thermoguttaceae bacterium]